MRNVPVFKIFVSFRKKRNLKEKEDGKTSNTCVSIVVFT